LTKKRIKSSNTVVSPAEGLGLGLIEAEGVTDDDRLFEALGDTDAEGEGVGLELADGDNDGEWL